jgi:hypothetical protein
MSRDQKKQILARLRVHLAMRDMVEAEAKIFFEDYLRLTGNLTVEEFQKVADRILTDPGRKWFPTIGEWKEFERKVVRRDPVVERPVLPPPVSWTQEQIDSAQLMLDDMKDGGVKSRLTRMLGIIREKHDGEV